MNHLNPVETIGESAIVCTYYFILKLLKEFSGG